MTSQPNNTPAWGVPVGAPGGTPTAPAETQVLPPISPVSSPRLLGPTKAEVELRVTALHYALRLMGERGTAIPVAHRADVLRTAKDLETYLLTGQIA